MIQYLPVVISLPTKIFWFILRISWFYKKHRAYITLCSRKRQREYKKSRRLTLIKKLFSLLRLKLGSWDCVQMSALWRWQGFRRHAISNLRRTLKTLSFALYSFCVGTALIYICNYTQKSMLHICPVLFWLHSRVQKSNRSPGNEFPYSF